ncbi:glycosyltransferase family 4 protein [Allorhizobium sp. BGMRC 0089]|uniref:glycosyltransferase family 4 protein n=1 Tax=Allorhizobium sonneratiae TaxID=2934936 RepID=UPI002033BE05|nr:glycosyltransferase family 4 protein [Allorhizobium sonneratiae]MCM2293834.1 glycosyltransferase family 4 protein [Allorhizobium sonneratiae]
MRILFIDTVGKNYDPQTPLKQPMGGTQSAGAYLAGALARRGVEVAFMNSAPEDRVVDGVAILANDSMNADKFAAFNMVVVLSVAVGERFRRVVPAHVPMVLWCEYDADQAVVHRLSQPDERAAWSAYVMVSHWQLENYVRAYGLERERIHVIENAVSPAFLSVPVQPAWFETGQAPTLIYSSTPFRGLDILLQAFPAIRERVPDVQLKVFSGLKLYTPDLKPEQDQYHYLYALAKALPGVSYSGPVPQAELARQLAGVAALAYPSTFAETSCISVMEAMVSGADVITTSHGALPETLNGFGISIPLSRSIPELVRAYVDLVSQRLIDTRNNPEAASERRNRQIAFMRSQSNWDARAEKWIALAASLR